MKYTEFTYTDAKGKTTHREVLVIQEPSNKLMGIDVAELTQEERKEFSREYDEILADFVTALEMLKSDYDVKHNLRQFIETNIKDRV
jgi:hypothetical protein